MRAFKKEGRRGRGEWERGVGGAGGGERWAGWQAARAGQKKQASHHPGVSAHTEESRHCPTPNPTCRPSAGERVW